MDFQGFSQEDFQVFSIEGLEPRMEAIREQIQPKFRMIGEPLTDELAFMVGQEMYLHIAKHARRTVNPPKDTWLAIVPNKRGYKKYPHFQIGLFDDHVFIWLAYIYELPNKSKIAQNFLNHFKQVKASIPDDYYVSVNHMQKNAKRIEDVNLQEILTRFKTVKKAEFLVGRIIRHDDPILKDDHAFLDLARETFETLTPLYKISF